MTAVKICGINTPAAFDAAIEAGADFLGFVFFPPSPRYVTAETAAALSARLTGGPPRVGLFVEPTADVIAQVLGAVRLDALQVYGASEQTDNFRSRFGLPVWRAVGVGTRSDLPDRPYGADRLVIEAKAPAGATRPGGNATTFDWTILRGWPAPVPWILAGGLTPENVADAVRATGAPAVDVSSGVERMKGVKDPALIRQFIRAAKAAG
ncbi:MAG TPA: phosphoribosylanthranilate isomerase [Rhodopila sp.]|nr:phosphoribosylanthranilate isomerase [Rhodopila sp.]